MLLNWRLRKQSAYCMLRTGSGPFSRTHWCILVLLQSRLTLIEPERRVDLSKSQLALNRTHDHMQESRWSVVSLQSLPGSQLAGPAKLHPAFLSRKQVCSKVRKKSRCSALVERMRDCTVTHAPGPYKLYALLTTKLWDCTYD